MTKAKKRQRMTKVIQDHSHKPYKRQKKKRTAQNELKQKISRTGQAYAARKLYE